MEKRWFKMFREMKNEDLVESLKERIQKIFPVNYNDVKRYKDSFKLPSYTDLISRYPVGNVRTAETILSYMESSPDIKSLQKLVIPIFENDYNNDRQKGAFIVLREVMRKELRNYVLNKL